MTRKKILKPLTKIEIEWVDAFSSDLTSQSTIKDTLATFKPCIRHSVGYFVGEKENHIIFASEWDGGEDLGTVHQIPKGMIKKVTTLK